MTDIIKNKVDKEISLKELNPTQPDDGDYSPDSGPIEIYNENDEWYILNGNHRYYRKLESICQKGKVPVQITKNPYKNY